MISPTKIAAASACLLFLLSGCGPSDPGLGKVTGTVTIDGQPAADVMVTFKPKAAGGTPSSGITNASGEYVLMYDGRKEGAVIGEHRVEITSASGGGEAGGDSAAAPVNIPAAYNAESTMTKQVAEGDQKIDLEVKTQ